MKRKRTWLQIGAFLLTALLISLIGFCGYYFSKSECNTLSYAGVIILAVAIVTQGWLILSATHHLFKKPGWIIVLFFAIYAIGVGVYHNVENPETKSEKTCGIVKVCSPINNSLSMFFPTRGNCDGTAAFQIIILLSYLFFAILAFSLFGRRLINRSGYTLIEYSRRNIFWDNSKGGMLLAKDLLDKTISQQAIFVLPNTLKDDEEKDKALFEKIDSMGAVALYCDFYEIKKFLRGHRHFFLTEDQDWNAKTALKVIDAIEKSSYSGKVQLYIRTEIEEVSVYIESRRKELKKQGRIIEVKFFSQSDLTARQFIQAHPMLDCPEIKINTEKAKVEGGFNLLLLGFGWTGRELLHKSIYDSQFLGSTFKATIIDKEYETRYGDYPLLYDECISQYNLTFNPGRNPNVHSEEDQSVVGSKLFYEWVKANIKDYNRIIIALGDDATNIDVALKIAKLRNRLGLDDNEEVIMTHVKNVHKFRNYKTSNRYTKIFGDLAEIYTLDVVVCEKMDRIAKMVNYVYSLNGCEKFDHIDMQVAEDKWCECSIFFQNSNRGVAMNINNTFRLIGVDAADMSSLSKEQLETKIEEKIDILAENEHLRWNAFHYVSGVRRWSVSEMPENETESKKKDKYGNISKHACLLPFRELKSVSDYINPNREQYNKEKNLKDGDKDFKREEDFKQTDRRIVKCFPLFVKSTDNGTT